MALTYARTEVPAQLSINTSQRGTPTTIPNKHIPYCSPGPRPSPRQLDTPPASPPSLSQLIETTSLTYPPHDYERLCQDLPIFAITAAKLEAALNHLATQPLPSPKQVFPWMHGLHGDNHIQLTFFTARKKSMRRTPRCIRGITIVKAGGLLTHSKLKGAVAPDEVLQCCTAPREDACDTCGEFHEIDPREGFSVRNFQIQACKMATVSDIVVYGDSKTSRADVMRTARRISRAQAAWLQKMDSTNESDRLFNTFVLTDHWEVIEVHHPDIVALDDQGCMTGKVMDFFHWERVEMCSMAAPSEISHNVWLGPTPDANLIGFVDPSIVNVSNYDLMIEASDVAQLPDAKAFTALSELLEQASRSELSQISIPQLEFPSSGSILPPTWSQAEVDGLIETCAWIFRQANMPQTDERKRRDSKMTLSPETDRDGDRAMGGSSRTSTGHRILIHCTDGYTETSMLALAYYMYAEGVPVHEAWLQMHLDKYRNFFAYSSDVALLKAIQPRILQASPKHGGDIRSLCASMPDWMTKIDGSLPSRVLPYMYLGNLGHANNPGLLQQMRIGQVLSIGEPVVWPADAIAQWPKENLMFVDKVQDNGVDPLTEEFGRCLRFIEQGRRNGTATLVHCRVGVSRSATICIAEVMNELGLSFPRAYCFVRARRLNVIIQPHLRFSYELLKWEETQCERRGKPLRRELEWATIAREIAAMNRPYSRQS